MTDVLGLAAYLLLALAGTAVWRLAFVRAMPLEARLPIALAAGALFAALVMSALSLTGIEWTRTTVLPFIVIAIAAAPYAAWRVNAIARPSLHIVGILLFWLLTVYGTITARESCGDLPFTWGPKAVRWFRAGGIDAGVLHTWPQLTVDYPPLQTLLLAFSNVVSRQFSWWSAVLAAPIFLLATLALIHAWSRSAIGTLLAAATLAHTFTLAYPAGCAEPPLLLFEALAIGALTFVDHPRAQTFLISLGLAGAVFTKLEGTTFAIAVFLTILLVRRQPKRAFIVIVPAVLLFGAWMTFVFRNDLLFMYRGAKMPIYWETLPVVLRTLAKVARFELWGLPFLVPMVVIAIGNWRRALVPLAIALLTAGATVYFYIHYPDPVWWIESSSPRVLLTPLLALLIGAAAAQRSSDATLC